MPVDAESDATGRTSDNNFICLEVCTPVGGDRPQFLVWHECASLHSLQLMENERISQLSYLASRTQKNFFLAFTFRVMATQRTTGVVTAINWLNNPISQRPSFSGPYSFLCSTLAVPSLVEFVNWP